MFILYGLLAGFAAGLVLGGRPGALGDVKIHWVPVVLAGMLVQLVLFTSPVSDRVGDLGPVLYVGSTALVFAAVVRNYSLAGLPLVIVGAASNLTAIVTNGGYMPASPGAIASIGHASTTTYSNSAVIAHPVLEPLTDIFALPAWIPMTNVFSIGDVFISAGVGVVVALVMLKSRRTAPLETIANLAVPGHTGEK